MKKEEKDTPWMHLVDVLIPKKEDGDGDDDEFFFQTIRPGDLALYKYKIGRDGFMITITLLLHGNNF